MADERDWHRLFGLLLADSFAGSPFTVEGRARPLGATATP